MSDSLQVKGHVCAFGGENREAIWHLNWERRLNWHKIAAARQEERQEWEWISRRKTRVRVRPQLRKAKSRRDCAARLNLESKKSGTSKTKQKAERFCSRFNCQGEAQGATQRWHECGIPNLTPQFHLESNSVHLNSVSPQFHLNSNSLQFHLESNSVSPHFHLNSKTSISPRV